jgi:opacity protein-like surface antigen
MKGHALVVAVAGLLVCLIAGSAAAQVTWETGFKGGLGFGKLRGDTQVAEVVDPGPPVIALSGDLNGFRTGFAGGAFVTARITEAFGIRLEALYAQKGGKGTVTVTQDGSPVGTATFTFKLDYFEVPVLAVGSFPAGAKAKVNVFGGPAVAFKARANVRAEAQGVSDQQDIGDSVESTDFGIAAGAGVSFAASERTNIVIDGRYTLGLSKVDKGGTDLKNGGLVFLAGLSFPLGGGSAAP